VTLRERQAEEARTIVRQAALGAFLEHGYVATTIGDIATRAGVARQTVYNLFGSKATLLVAVIHDRVAGAEVRSQGQDHAAVVGADDPRTMIDGLVAATIGVAERTLPIYRVALEASVIDEVVARHLDRNEQDRYEAQAFFVEALSAKGFLRTDISVEELRRGAWLLAAPDAIIRAVDAGWTLAQYGAWLRETMSGWLFGPVAGRNGG
jgi:AcrR family transcriptional regulator